MKNIIDVIAPEDQGKNIAGMFRSTALAMIATEITGVIAVFIDGIITSSFLGIDAYSGVSLLKPFTSLILLAAGMLSTGCNVLCSRLVGIGKKEEANEIFNLSLFFSLVIGALFILVSAVFPQGVLTVCGVDLNKYPELNTYLYDYLYGYMAGIPAVIMIQVIGPNLVMDNGKTRFALSSAVLCVTDIAGDLLNVFVFHGGVLGMGIATSVSMAVQLVILLPCFFRKDSFFRISLKKLRFKNTAELIKNGSPAFVKKLAGTLRDILTNYLNITVALTASAIAAKGIQSDYSLFLFCIPTGLGRTLITMVGIYYSANDLQGMKSLYSFSIRYGLLLSSVTAVITFTAAPLLAGAYTNDPEVHSLAVFSLHWISLALLFDTCLTLIQHYYQGIGQLKQANLLSFSERFIVPVGAALVLGLLFGSKGILASLAVGKLILLLGVFIASCIRCRGIPKTWKDVMFLPEDFGGKETDNMYAVIRTMEEVIRTSVQTQEFCRQHNTGERQAMLMALFVEEMASNAIRHAPDQENKPTFVDFRLFIRNGEICFSMMDRGNLFDPALFYRLHHDDAPEKHIGIRMVTNMAKEVRYFSTFRSNNLVVNLNCDT